MLTERVMPHIKIVVSMSWAAILGYAAFSIWVFSGNGDAAMKGDVLGTWKSFAVLAFGFWLGSSSGGKTQSPVIPASGKGGDPVHVLDESRG